MRLNHWAAKGLSSTSGYSNEHIMPMQNWQHCLQVPYPQLRILPHCTQHLHQAAVGRTLWKAHLWIYYNSRFRYWDLSICACCRFLYELGQGLAVQALWLSGYSHYPLHQPQAQLLPNQRVILWLALEDWNGARARSCCWRDSYMHIEKSSVVFVVMYMPKR